MNLSPGRPPHVFDYTPIDLESEYRPPQPSPAIPDPATYYAYTDDGQLESITRPDGGVITYVHDPNSAQLEHQILPAGQGQINYVYHPETASSGAGLPHFITAPDGGTLIYTYGGALPFQEAWDGSAAGTFSGSVERAYDHHHRVIGLTVNWADLVLNQFDADGFLMQAGDLVLARNASHGLIDGTTLGNVTDAYSYNGFGEVIGYEATANGSSVYAVSYDRDDAGQITHRSESIDGGPPVSTYYRYDAPGRLYRVCDDAACTSIRAEYTYDDNGNRNGGFDPNPITATYDDQDRLLSYQAATYTYTANGELATKTDAGGTTTYEYDALGNLRHVVLPGGLNIDYVIDAKNRRIGKKENGVLVQGFLYEDQLRPIAELDPNGVVVSRFVYGERPNVPEYIVKGASTYRIVHDQVGSPRFVVDVQTGTVVQELTYDAFGNVLADTSPGFQPFGFAGGLWEADAGLVRFGARDYDPVTGRWTAKDPIGFEGGDPLLFGYVLGDPVNSRDPNGMEAITGRAMLVSMILGGIKNGSIGVTV